MNILVWSSLSLFSHHWKASSLPLSIENLYTDDICDYNALSNNGLDFKFSLCYSTNNKSTDKYNIVIYQN